MKNAEGGGQMTDVERGIVQVADLRIDLDRRVVERDDRPLTLKGRSFDLLRALVERWPAVADHRGLLGSVWRDRVVTGAALSQRVRLLRKALGDERGDDGYIVAVHGQGYRLAHAPRRPPARQQQRVALVRRDAWYALAAGLAALTMWLAIATPHAIKHFVRHLLN
jgi:DNA-binding winged helix-turn-helix (wHTH) protein